MDLVMGGGLFRGGDMSKGGRVVRGTWTDDDTQNLRE